MQICMGKMNESSKSVVEEEENEFLCPGRFFSGWLSIACPKRVRLIKNTKTAAENHIWVYNKTGVVPKIHHKACVTFNQTLTKETIMSSTCALFVITSLHQH